MLVGQKVTSRASRADVHPKVIDADGHIMEPPDLWSGRYMVASYRPMGPSISTKGRLQYPNGTDVAEGRSWLDVGTLGSERPLGTEPSYADGRKGATDPDGRVEDLDLDGIDIVALYPTVGLSTCYVGDPELASAMARAYNRWIADWAGSHPDRLMGVAMLPIHSVDAAVTELRFSRVELGLRAAFLRPHVYRGRTIHNNAWDPLWAEAQDLDCPIALHGGGVWPVRQAGADRFTDGMCPPWAGHVVTHPFEQQLAFVGLILGGVFDRFPTLRIAFLESGGGWVVPILDRIGRHYEQHQTWITTLKLAHYRQALSEEVVLRKHPREYFEQNCWVSFEPTEEGLRLVADWIGPEKILWATDYPHRDGFFPNAPAMIKAKLEGCSERTKRGVLGGGAQAFYNI